LNIHRFIELGWKPQAIADREGCSLSMIYKMEQTILTYGTLRKPIQGKLGRPLKVSREDEEALFDEMVRSGWMYQDEIAYWLMVERGVFISQPTISRMIKRNQWSARSIRPFSINRNEELREYYRRDMEGYAAEDLVFLDESLFNEKTGWRHKAYAPVGKYNTGSLSCCLYTNLLENCRS
jgi:transposase